MIHFVYILLCAISGKNKVICICIRTALALSPSSAAARSAA